MDGSARHGATGGRIRRVKPEGRCLVWLAVAAIMAATGCTGNERSGKGSTGKETGRPGATTSGMAPADTPLVAFGTSAGHFTVELYPWAAPRTVANFLGYVRSGFYDGLIFHRVIPQFVIQGGGLDPQLQERQAGPPIPNEASNGLANRRGTIAMARTQDPNSATSQFYINLADNPSLDQRPGSAGYAVFGRLRDGLGVVDSIARAPTGERDGFQDVPVHPVIIDSARVLRD